MGQRKQRAQKGFTFIELIMVVTVIGVLASILLPQARGYAQRAKVQEGVLALASCRNSVHEAYFSGSESPGEDNWGCEADTPSRYVQQVRTTYDGVVRVLLGHQIADLRLQGNWVTMAPLNRANQPMGEDDYGTSPRRWRCGAVGDGTSPEIVAFLPSSCRG